MRDLCYHMGMANYLQPKANRYRRQIQNLAVSILVTLNERDNLDLPPKPAETHDNYLVLVLRSPYYARIEAFRRGDTVRPYWWYRSLTRIYRLPASYRPITDEEALYLATEAFLGPDMGMVPVECLDFLSVPAL